MTYALAQFVVTATIFAVVFFFSLSPLTLPHFALERHKEMGKVSRNHDRAKDFEMFTPQGKLSDFEKS